MSRYGRKLGSICWAHSACETCRRPICDDCPDIPDTCTHH